MIEDMTLHMTEAELARDLHAALAKVQQGTEIVIEQDSRPVAVISSPSVSGRAITDILQEAKHQNSSITLDEDFGKDLEEIIASHREPWNPPPWD